MFSSTARSCGERRDWFDDLVTISGSTTNRDRLATTPWRNGERFSERQNEADNDVVEPSVVGTGRGAVAGLTQLTRTAPGRSSSLRHALIVNKAQFGRQSIAG